MQYYRYLCVQRKPLKGHDVNSEFDQWFESSSTELFLLIMDIKKQAMESISIAIKTSRTRYKSNVKLERRFFSV